MPFENDPFATDAPTTPSNDHINAKEAPIATATTPNPFKIGFTLKAADQMSGEWLTPCVYGGSAQETAERGRDLLVAMQEVGLIDLTAKAAEYTRAQYKGPAKAAGKPTFQNGQVQRQAPAASSGGDEFTCEHGRRTFKDGGSWAAQFCGAPQGTPKGDQCPPLWRQKNGSFAAK
ncbi:hypothetical protein [Streptomyces vinaceus]|uniref:hypothetical protein n=1 Tax=Streptomyces vinaceus TaxID=1960 RepID=UPI0036ACEB6C